MNSVHSIHDRAGRKNSHLMEARNRTRFPISDQPCCHRSLHMHDLYKSIQRKLDSFSGYDLSSTHNNSSV